MAIKYLLALTLSICCLTGLAAHNLEGTHAPLRVWRINEKHTLNASFLMIKDSRVYLEDREGQVLNFPLSDFSREDLAFIHIKQKEIAQLNASIKPAPNGHNWAFTAQDALWILAALAYLLFLGYILPSNGKKWSLSAASLAALFLLSFKLHVGSRLMGTDPQFVDSAFQPFKSNLATHWDNNWFYVESNGIPATHPMMAGITKWQQQVPIPQCYNGNNAWQIPLNPVLAVQPVPVNAQHFLRGAVAIAANGIPIFNPFTNTGVDAQADGQLDQWGGHCGRADDYHYHIAPLHLDPVTSEVLPIAFALDGFAVYGAQEPDGSAMLPLDANHGHFDNAGVYHYHGTANPPYMIGNMVGKVTEDTSSQIVPQASAKPIRPFLQPLSGASIISCVSNGTNNGYNLSYTRNGGAYNVEYSWTPGGKYTFNFVSPTGTTTQTYNGHLPCSVSTPTQEAFVLASAVFVYPNPSVGDVYVKISEPEGNHAQNLQVFDLNGRLLQQQNATTTTRLEGLEKGVYILKIIFEHGSTSRKIVVQ